MLCTFHSNTQLDSILWFPPLSDVLSGDSDNKWGPMDASKPKPNAQIAERLQVSYCSVSGSIILLSNGLVSGGMQQMKPLSLNCVFSSAIWTHLSPLSALSNFFECFSLMFARPTLLTCNPCNKRVLSRVITLVLTMHVLTNLRYANLPVIKFICVS